MEIPTPNVVQVQRSVRWFISNVATSLAAFAVGKGWITKDTAVQILADPMVYTIGVSFGMWVWSMVSSTKKNLQVAVAETDPTTMIVTTPEVAAATPDNPNIVSRTDVKVTPK